MASTQDLQGTVGATGSTPAAAATPTSSTTPATTPPAGEPGGSGGPPVERTPGRSFLVGMIIVFLVGATLAMVGFIWYRWSGVREPTTAVIVEGDATLDGTQVLVRGQTRQGESRSVNATLTKANGFVVPVLLEPGTYTVVAQRDGQVLIRKQVEVKRFLGVRFQLAEYVKQATADGSLPPLKPRGDASSTSDPDGAGPGANETSTDTGKQ